MRNNLVVENFSRPPNSAPWVSANVSREKFRFFQSNFRKISIFPKKFPKNFDFFNFLPVKLRKIFIFPSKFPKNFDFSREKFRFFSREIDEEFRFLRQNFPNNLFLVIYSKMSVFLDKICHLQLNSRQIILFRLKSHHFRIYYLYMIRYNNASRPPTVPCDPHDPLPKIWGVATSQPPGLTPLY